MLLVLSGPSAVGKSFCVDYLCTRYNFKTVVPFTSRSPRVTEAEGIHYHFRSRQDLEALSQNMSAGYWGYPLSNDDVYGYTEELDELIPKPHLYVIQASAELAKQIKAKHKSHHDKQQLILAFLNFQDRTVLAKKLQERFGSSHVDERLRHADREIAQRDAFDIQVAANDPYAIAHQLVKLLVETYDLVLPPHFAPPLYGAMSDRDIINSLTEPEGIRFPNLDNEQLRSRVNGWSVDLTLGDRYWTIDTTFKSFDLADGSDDELDRRFPRHRATRQRGITLGPGEFILTVTHEHLQLPKSIVGIFAGRTSYANVGLSIELSQIILQPGHDSPVRLQIRNNLPSAIQIYPGMTLVQVVFFRLESPASRKYIDRATAHYKTREDVISKFYTDPVLVTVRQERELTNTPFPWSAAHEVAQLLLGAATISAFLAFLFGHVETAKWLGVVAGVAGVPVFITRLRNFKQRRWR